MRKIIVLEFITLDGVMQAPGGPEEDTSGGFKYGGWTFPYFDEFTGKEMAEQMNPVRNSPPKGPSGAPSAGGVSNGVKSADLLLGRKTFEIFANYWPKHESGWPGINDVTKYCVSETMVKSDWKNSVFLKNVDDIKKLKNSEGADLQVWGSGNLVQTLLKNDLVDELKLKIFPITLGNGKKIFAEGTIPAAFKLTDSKVSPSGVIFANYKREGEVKTGSF